MAEKRVKLLTPTEKKEAGPASVKRINVINS